jgi:lipid-A-disaccharide synthase
MTSRKPLHIAIVAGEQSGDNLAADLITELRKHYPDARFFGIAGARMQQAGCEVWESAESLSVMGIFEIIPHLRRLLRVRKQLIKRVLIERPDVYIGVDYKEFNLSVERKLKAAGIRTVQYVSPQVWAWRQGRVKNISQAVDLMLCLLPFEKPFYDAHHVNARFVGHPLADQIPVHCDTQTARSTLGLSADARVVAILPGSRIGEVSRLGPDFARTVAWLRKKDPHLQFIAPMANTKVQQLFEQLLRDADVQNAVHLLDGQAQTALMACDAVLLASGTATLEAALFKKPMVVAYRLGRLTTFLLKHLGLMKAKYFSQPNLLANRLLVPEFYNHQVCAEVLGPAVMAQFERNDKADLITEFTRIHLQLKQNASAQAATAIQTLLSV